MSDRGTILAIGGLLLLGFFLVRALRQQSHIANEEMWEVQRAPDGTLLGLRVIRNVGAE